MSAEERPIGNGARRGRDRSGRRFPLVEANETNHPAIRTRLGHEVELRGRNTGRIIYQPADLPLA